VIVNFLLINPKIFIHSFLIIILIQIIDDLLDTSYDLIYGYFNLANKYGKGEMLIISMILITASFMISVIDTSLILLICFCINYLYSEK